MTAPPVLRLFTVLGAPDVDARFVGGCVRNAVMGAEVGEIDVATPERPDQVLDRLAAAGFKAVPTGLSHGTITAIVDGISFEITSLRRDTACDGRHADVEFTGDWQQDLRRRDFTMNAMSLRPDGMLFDDHGGIEDAKAGRVRFVGDAADRIQEDYLRILRLFRFFAWYGRVPLDKSTIAACQTKLGGLQSLSAERVKQEMTKTLSAPQPALAVMAMHSCGVLQVVLPEANSPSVLEVLVRIEREAPLFPPDGMRRLAALIPVFAIANVAQRLKLSNAERARLNVLNKNDLKTFKNYDRVAFHRRLYTLGAAVVVDQVLLAWSQSSIIGDGDLRFWRAILDEAVTWSPRYFPVTGDDVLALGVPQGPEVGELLSVVEKYWIDADFAPSRSVLLAELRKSVENYT